MFPESSVNSKVAETLARETGATARYELYGDTLGPAGSSGDTYLKMEIANADAIVRGLHRREARMPELDTIRAADTRELVAARGLTAGYAGAPAIEDVTLHGRSAGCASGCSAPTAAARPRCSGCCSARCAPLAGTRRPWTAAAAPCRRPSARGSTTR